MNPVARIARTGTILFWMQMTYYVVPLVMLPYLLRVMGLEAWGQVALLLTFSQLVFVGLDFGFSIFAVQEAARRRGSRDRLAALFGAVTMAKGIVTVLFLPVLAGIAAFVPHVADHPSAFLWAFLAVAVQVHETFWLFLGIERTRLMGVMAILFRWGGVVAVLLLIKGADDLALLFQILFVQWVLVVGHGIWMVRRSVGFGLRNLQGGRAILRKGWAVYQFQIPALGAEAALPLVLGAVTSPAVVGLYVGAEKLARVGTSLLGVIRLAMLPQMAAQLQENRQQAIRLLRRLLLLLSLLAVAGGAFMAGVAEPLILMLFGDDLIPSVAVLRVLSVLPLLSILHTVLSAQWLLPNGFGVAVRNVYLIGGGVRLGLCAVLAGSGMVAGWSASGGAMGAAWAVVSAEVLMVCGCLFLLRRA